MHRIDGHRVSPEWHDVLSAARADHVQFVLNSGQRTMSEQLALYVQNMSGGRPRPGRPLTARPTPWAPHIRVGRPDHALDVSTLDGGETDLQRWLERRGATVTNPVPGEPWHLEIPQPDLLRLAADARAVAPALRKGSVHPTGVRRLQRLLRALNVKGVPLNGRYDLATRAGVKRFQRKHGIATDPRATVGPKTWAALQRGTR